MSWDVRRLANAIENVGILLAFAALIITGHRVIAWVLFAIMCINDVLFAADWIKHGEIRK